jgi:ABC-type polar amino acid transport system ATPase subunit
VENSSEEAVIELQNVSKSFHNEKVLDGISLKLTTGGFYVIIGRSGCGKSTLLRLLNGLETAEEGNVFVENELLTKVNAIEVRKKVGMVFQSFQLFPHMNLIENILRPQIIVKKTSYEEARENALSILNRVGLSGHSEKYPYQLSGGQQQRGAIARALALKPKVMLYDEPTSALDPELVDEVHQVMKSIDHKEMTQIIVTHEMRFAREIADEIIYMDKGQIVERGQPEQIFKNAREEKTREFLRKFQ